MSAAPSDTLKSSQLALTIGALGVVFGDIGTSPLYAIKQCFSVVPGLDITHDNVIGILSMVFWSLTLVVSIQYITLLMRANNNGEGGIMSLMALVLRGRYKRPWARPLMIVLGLFGAALFLGDGMITPAISVLSAAEGLKVVSPDFEPFIIPITLAVITVLFALQRHGTGSMGAFFGPVMLLWFGTLAFLGAINISHAPEVLTLINPYWAIMFIEEHAGVSMVIFGAVVLTITGGEAIYADMGHFGHRPIRRAWFYMAFPALVLNYCGQGALLLEDPANIENPFFLLAPDWALYPLIIFATLATVVASQACISGVFSIARQAMLLGYLPRFEVRHTSNKEIGQIYIPFFNWLLFAAVCILVMTFQSSENLAAAYGIAVTMTMTLDAILLIVVAIKIWHWRPELAALLIVPFILLDIAYFSSTSLKIIHGGWLPVIIGITAFFIMATWKRGRDSVQTRLNNETMPLSLFVNSIGASAGQTVQGTAVFMNSSLEQVPHALLHNMKHNKIIHERNIVLRIATKDVPFVEDSERLSINEISHHFYLITANYGFKEQPDIEQIFALCRNHSLNLDVMDTSFFVSREHIIPNKENPMHRLRQMLYIVMARNAVPVTDFFSIPSNRVVEMGTQIRL